MTSQFSPLEGPSSSAAPGAAWGGTGEDTWSSPHTVAHDASELSPQHPNGHPSDLSDTPGEPLASEGADGAVPYPSTLSADPWVTAHPRSNTGGGGSLSSAAAVRRFPASSDPYETSVSEEYGGGFSRDGADEMPLDEGRVETVLVSYKDQLAGFLLKHKLWSITTSLSSEAITRRYADFPVLLAHFTARYPFRVLPALPPKRLLGGKYLGGVAVDDAAFLEERRRGLERFLRAALAHPVLRKDEFLRVFLTERAELSVLRSTSSMSSTGEEGNLSPLSPAQLSSIPNDLEATLSQLRAALPKLITHWDKIVSALRQTLAKRESIALDYALLKGTCEGAVTAERSGWSDERGESGRGAERGIETLSWGDYLAKDAALINEGNTRCREGPLEGLLRHLALYKALHALFVRHAVLSSDAVEKLRTRTKNTAVKIQTIRSSASSPDAPKKLAVLASALTTDETQIFTLLQRREYIRYVLSLEISWLARATGSPLRETLVSFGRESAEQGARTEGVWIGFGEGR